MRNIVIADDIKKGVCQCRSCKRTFNQEELKTVKMEHFGHIIKEKVCPYCGKNTYGILDYSIDEENLIYKSKNFWKKDLSSKNNIKQYNVKDFINEEDCENYWNE